jgi:hypothetical protein
MYRHYRVPLSLTTATQFAHPQWQESKDGTVQRMTIGTPKPRLTLPDAHIQSETHRARAWTEGDETYAHAAMNAILPVTVSTGTRLRSVRDWRDSAL